VEWGKRLRRRPERKGASACTRLSALRSPPCMSSRNALNKIGEDLSFTVSYTIASELRDSAIEAGAQPEELIPLVFVIYLVLLYVPQSLLALWRALLQFFQPLHAHPVDEAAAANDQTKKVTEEVAQKVTNTLFGFFSELLASATRIALSLAVQLVARSVTTRESKWQLRVLTLASIAIFFRYVEATGSASVISELKDK
jgi:hypothetical protein